MRPGKFALLTLAAGAVVFALALAVGSDYVFFAGYVVLQFIVLATAWNILGTYTTVALHKIGTNAGRYLSGTAGELLQPLLPLSVPTLVILSGAIAGLI